MPKIYYNEKGWVCERYPYDIPIEDENRFIEVPDEKYYKTLSTQDYYAWRVVNGKLVNEEYDALTAEQVQEKSKSLILSEIEEHKQYLSDTDYVVTKLTEAQAIGDDEWLVDLRAEYATVLDERKRRREIINQLQKQLE